jgi:hypothetical protein
MKEEFEIRTMGVGELAQLYNPTIGKGSASNTLRKWIVQNKQLHHRLKEAGYRKHVKVLTPRQVEIIVKSLGVP